MEALDRWEPWKQNVVMSGGPMRVNENPDPSFVSRPVGFTAAVAASSPALVSAVEPLLWDGDQS